MSEPHYITAVSVVVRHAEKMSPAAVARLVERLILAGQEDAANTPDDWEDPDAARAASLRVAKVQSIVGGVYG